MHENYAAKYRALWDRHWWWRARHVFISRVIQSLPIVPESYVLDVGCGDALLFEDLARYGSVCGIEPDARLIHPENPHRDRIEVAPFGPSYITEKRFSLITMLDVLEHIEDDRGTLMRVRELLVPGGYLVLTVPALQWLWSMHDVANQHYRRYTRATLASRLNEAGFVIERCGYLFGWTVAAMLMRRVLAPAGRKNDDAAVKEYEVAVPPVPINAAMYSITRMEQIVMRSIGLPIGSSVFAVAKRADDAESG